MATFLSNLIGIDSKLATLQNTIYANVYTKTQSDAKYVTQPALSAMGFQAAPDVQTAIANNTYTKSDVDNFLTTLNTQLTPAPATTATPTTETFIPLKFHLPSALAKLYGKKTESFALQSDSPTWFSDKASVMAPHATPVWFGDQA